MLYDADGILLKNVSNKRWVKNLYETINSYNTEESLYDNLKTLLEKTKDIKINSFVGGFLGQLTTDLYYTNDSVNLYIRYGFVSKCNNVAYYRLNKRDLESNFNIYSGSDYLNKYFSNYCSDKLSSITKIIDIENPSDETNVNLGKAIAVQNFLLKINLKKLTITPYIESRVIGAYLKKNDIKINENIEKIFNIATSDSEILTNETLSTIIFNNQQKKSFFSKLFNKKDNDLEINEIKIKQKENVKPDISDDTKARTSILWDVKVAGKNQLKDSNLKKAVIPEIKTKVLINDEKFRTLDNVCSMVMNNVTKLKNSLKIFNYDKNSLKTLFYSDEDLDQYNFFNKMWTKKELQEQNDKYPEAVKFFSTTEQQKIQARVCYVYYEMMRMAKDGLFNNDIEYSRGLNYCLHNYLIEITSPMTILKNAITWNTLNGKQGNKVLEEVVGLKESQWEQNSYIMYPLSSTYPLADSILNMNGKILKVSTKGGLDGKGAFATLKSLREYVFEGKNGSGNITDFGRNIKNQYPDLFNIFDILTNKEWGKDITKYEWDEMYNNIRNKIGKKNIDIHKQIQEYINKDVNTSWTKMIMKILESASYDFVQVNAKASNTSGDFHFNYTAQYPAVFNGKVKLDLKDTGKATFHIEA